MSYVKSSFSDLCNFKIFEKRKMAKFWTKNVFLKYFWGKLFKTLCGIWSQHPQICGIGKFCEKKMLKFENKNPLCYQECLILVFLGWNFKINYCHIWNQHPRICVFDKFCRKTKMPKFKTKNAIFVYFWPKMSYLLIFGLEF